jgi:DNA modification methylase
MKTYLGDCLEIMKSLPDKSIDMVLADPPYGTTACKWDSVIPFEPMWAQIKRIAKPKTAICIFGSEPFSSTLRMSNVASFKYDWIWEKTAATGFLNSKKRPLTAHECVSVFADGSPVYDPQFAKGDPYRVEQRGVRASDCYGAQEYVTTENDGSRYPRSVVRFKKDKQHTGLHPTQKPVALLEYLIKTYTKHGEVVLDFCMGSGSTGVACVNTGRDFIGIEKEEKYFEIANKRIDMAAIVPICDEALVR